MEFREGHEGRVPGMELVPLEEERGIGASSPSFCPVRVPQGNGVSINQEEDRHRNRTTPVPSLGPPASSSARSKCSLFKTRGSMEFLLQQPGLTKADAVVLRHRPHPWGMHSGAGGGPARRGWRAQEPCPADVSPGRPGTQTRVPALPAVGQRRFPGGPLEW